MNSTRRRDTTEEIAANHIQSHSTTNPYKIPENTSNRANLFLCMLRLQLACTTGEGKTDSTKKHKQTGYLLKSSRYFIIIGPVSKWDPVISFWIRLNTIEKGTELKAAHAQKA